jgi:hypothetical protein
MAWWIVVWPDGEGVGLGDFGDLEHHQQEVACLDFIYAPCTV